MSDGEPQSKKPEGTITNEWMDRRALNGVRSALCSRRSDTLAPRGGLLSVHFRHACPAFFTPSPSLHLDSDFQQQRLKAWQPLLTPKWVSR